MSSALPRTLLAIPRSREQCASNLYLRVRMRRWIMLAPVHIATTMMREAKYLNPNATQRGVSDNEGNFETTRPSHQGFVGHFLFRHHEFAHRRVRELTFLFRTARVSLQTNKQFVRETLVTELRGQAETSILGWVFFEVLGGHFFSRGPRFSPPLGTSSYHNCAL